MLIFSIHFILWFAPLEGAPSFGLDLATIDTYDLLFGSEIINQMQT